MAEVTDGVARQIRAAWGAGDLSRLEPLFAPEARWGNCVGGRQILEWMHGVRSAGIEAELITIEAATDRLVLTLAVQQAGADDVPASPAQPHYQTAHLAEGLIIEIQDAADRDAALTAEPGAPPPSPVGPRTGVTTAAPILPVRDLGKALERYRQLGFAVRAYGGGGYGFVERGGIEFHLGEVPDLDQSTNLSAVYVMVDDADALGAEWRTAPVDGQHHDVIDTEYGMREGAYIDPDGNRIRFGSPIEE